MRKLNLQEETKYDFLIDSTRKKIWQSELDMVEIIDTICRKYNIDYSLSGGSLLGAIRHDGFIPWDDDIDIMMLRKDYEKFLEVAQKEVKSPYFLQYYKTEDGYYYGHAQLRNSNTTALIGGDIYNNFNHGIFVDIFPLDNVPDDEIECERFLNEIRKKKKILSTYIVKHSDNILKKIAKELLYRIYWKFKNINEELKKFEKLCDKYNNIKTKECGLISFLPNGKKYENAWLNEYIEVDFEYLKLKIIKEYDMFLKRMYGDYMTIPKHKGGSLHGNVFFDTEKSYTEYEKNKKEIISKL